MRRAQSVSQDPIKMGKKEAQAHEWANPRP